MARILIIDDDPDIVEAMRVVLESKDYKVVSAKSGAEGLKKIKLEKPDLVILDVMMERGIDGIETYRRIRALRPLQRAIMLSGSAHPDQVKSLRLLGVESYLIKPVTLPLLAHAIRAELDRP